MRAQSVPGFTTAGEAAQRVLADVERRRCQPVVEIPGEEWRAFTGFGSDFYEVSDLGRVRRIATRTGRRMDVPTLLCLRVSAKGYSYVTLTEGGIYKLRPVHHLVLLAFVGPRPDGHETDHRDTNRLNNTPGNLRWVTHAENIAHKVAVGNAKSTIPAPTVRAIRAASGTLQSIASEHGVHLSTVSRIRRGEARKATV